MKPTKLLLTFFFLSGTIIQGSGKGGGGGGEKPLLEHNPLQLKVKKLFLTPPNSNVVTMIAKERDDLSHLEFRVFPIDDQWDAYFIALDGYFTSNLEKAILRYASDLKIQEMLKSNEVINPSILIKIRKELIEICEKSQGYINKTISKTQVKTQVKISSLMLLKSRLEQADNKSLLRVLKNYLLRDMRPFGIKQWKLSRVFFELKTHIAENTYYEVEEDEEQVKVIKKDLMRKYSFLPNQSITSMKRYRSRYIAIVYDKEEDLPVMNVNIYPRVLPDGTKYQENRYISKNHTYGLIKTLKGEKPASRLALLLHAAALRATNYPYFEVKPDGFAAMKNILEKPGYVDSAEGKIGFYRTNKKFKKFSTNQINILKTDITVFEEDLDSLSMRAHGRN